ncbi:putative secreted protein (Por secretion system target) [Breznakibacter xylanolyticus]|uniref:Putative secreted protein (Por secretion system target) n=1 Tax=Breznakibacter xylanolyticus TaxID=990 RepID=A0A2W7NK39_9BACT|nr:family 16 glycosylhydrolase [Breznakibacter xylanolyticus]PZX20811.1 putative secreted protein (Por secretion system target) [Breznakibacter xylanolyticus]
MKKLLAASLLMLPLMSGAQNYQLVWEDQFDEPALNETFWTIQVNGDGGGNNELQYYRRENISIENHPTENVSCLVLNAKRENYLNKTCTSGRVVTQNKVSCRYGKIEARIHLPHTANGLWPAFWMMGEDIATVGWPQCGETDILEMGHASGITNGTQDRLFNGACHWGPSWQNHPMYAKETTWPTSIQEGFHLFTLVWTETAIKMYLDQDKNPNVAPYYEMAITNTATLNDPGHYFHKPFHILLNLAVGGNFPGIWDINKVTALDANGTAAKMYIDYVRIYQQGTVNEVLNVPGQSNAITPDAATSKKNVHLNPVIDHVMLDDFEQMDEVAIVSLKGEMVQKITPSTNRIDLTSLSAGLYLLRIAYKNHTNETHKLVKL